MKKVVVYLSGCAIFLLVCWKVGKMLNPEQENSSYSVEESSENEDGSESKYTSEIKNASEDDKISEDEANSKWSKYELTFENAMDTLDNPWGFTAGMINIDTEGKVIFLTPNTSVYISGVREEIMGEGLTIEMSIYPQVADLSDGAGVKVWYLADNNDILQQESFETNSKEGRQKVILACKDERVTSIRLLCNNGISDNDVGDWVIIK